VSLERISIEVTNRCGKACWFCYNQSHAGGDTAWTPDELVGFVADCTVNGIRAVSFGGGEPLQYAGLIDVLEQLRGMLFRSITTNGLLLSGPVLDRLVAASPDKVHVSIHFPEREREVLRAIRQVTELTGLGIRSGINLLVQRSMLDAASAAAESIRAAGITNDRIVYLPMRGQDTPSPDQLAEVAGRQPFQSMTCLSACGISSRFCSIGWDRTAAWCSYTTARRPLPELSFAGLRTALDGLGLVFCGGIDGS
jgi:organic radical activating enzyme